MKRGKSPVSLADKVLNTLPVILTSLTNGVHVKQKAECNLILQESIAIAQCAAQCPD